MHDRPIIALDIPTQKEVAVFLEKFPKEEAL
ncbi:orotidine-5'-phosphate decarboxylase, partial [Enterococcus faecalis]